MFKIDLSLCPSRGTIKTWALLSLILVGGCTTPTGQGPGSWFSLTSPTEESASTGASMIYADGTRYEGEFKNGLRHGRGIQTWPDGAKYEGDFLNDTRTGQGLFTWPSGNRYDGGFVDGKRQGRGVYTWGNGSRYEGEYQNGERDGEGVFFPVPAPGQPQVQERQIWRMGRLDQRFPSHPLNEGLATEDRTPASHGFSPRLARRLSLPTGQSPILQQETAPAPDDPPPDFSDISSKISARNHAILEESPTPSRWTDPSSGITLSLIPEGCFTMGQNHGPKNEAPEHQVCLDSYWIGQFEVTQEQWQKVMEPMPVQKRTGKNLPVENVTWHQVQQFIQTLSTQSGAQFQLPSEAQWEYACSGGGQDTPYCGSGPVTSLGWMEENANKEIHEVGQLQANRFGLFDMTGNLWEWVEDWYDETYYAISPKKNPPGPAIGSSRVFKGGAWLSKAEFTRSSLRYDLLPDRSYHLLGFRLAASRLPLPQTLGKKAPKGK